MMFQDYALFPHLTVEKNIGFGLRRWEKQARANVETRFFEFGDFFQQGIG